MLFRQVLLVVALILTLTGCTARSHSKLVSVQITDHQGMVETFSSQERLEPFKNISTETPQPYSQLVRVYKNDQLAQTHALVTSYYPNGQPQRSLEVLGGQAHGLYQEWHYNGQLKLQAFVSGGQPELSEAAERSWLFEGVANAWDDEGNLRASISYVKGKLDGRAESYHANGKIWKSQSLSKGRLEGKSKIYRSNGELLSEQSYKEGVLHGPSQRFWEKGAAAAKEEYHQGKLISGVYFSPKGKVLSQVTEGSGYRAVFRKTSLYRLEEVQEGSIQGSVREFSKEHKLVKKFFTRGGLKHGQEVYYYTHTTLPCKRLSIEWDKGVVSGKVCTWYESGVQESERRISQHQSPRTLSAWFRDGSKMLEEVYQSGRLLEGAYFRPGSNSPISLIRNGNGRATIFDSEGALLREVVYQGGEPLLQ